MVVGQEHRGEATPGGGGLDRALPFLRCPVCHAALHRDGGALRCAQGHAFDIARQGHVHLTAGSRRLAGDTAEMVAARSAFLGAGHLAPIDEALVVAAADIAAEGAIVDLGGGTGQHLTPVLDALPDRTGIVLDSSTPALRRAARAHPHVAAIAADAWGPLPLRDGSVAAVLSVFAPRGAEELRRILAPGGLVLAVTPTARHLAELREPLGLLSTDAGKADRLAAQLGLRERARTLVETTLTLAAEEATQAARMGPAAHHDREQRPLPATVTATLSVELTVLCSAV